MRLTKHISSNESRNNVWPGQLFEFVWTGGIWHFASNELILLKSIVSDPSYIWRIVRKYKKGESLCPPGSGLYEFALSLVFQQSNKLLADPSKAHFSCKYHPWMKPHQKKNYWNRSVIMRIRLGFPKKWLLNLQKNILNINFQKLGSLLTMLTILRGCSHFTSGFFMTFSRLESLHPFQEVFV